MKKTICLTAVTVLIVTVLALAGCGGSSSSGSKSSASTVSEAELGVPIYPGATEDTSEAGPGMGGSAPEMPEPDSSMPQPPGSLPDHNGSAPQPPPDMPRFEGSEARPGPGNRTTLWTADSTEEVTDWYRNELRGKSGFTETTPRANAQGGPFAGGTMFSFESGETTRIVVVREDTDEDRGGTLIMIGEMPQGMPPGPGNNQTQ